jgi:hypothetical protein
VRSAAASDDPSGSRHSRPRASSTGRYRPRRPRTARCTVRVRTRAGAARETLAKRLRATSSCRCQPPHDEQQLACSTLRPVEAAERRPISACRPTIPGSCLPCPRPRPPRRARPWRRSGNHARAPSDEAGRPAGPRARDGSRGPSPRQPPADVNVGPDGREQLVRRHQPARVLGQVTQDGEALRPERDGSRSA